MGIEEALRMRIAILLVLALLSATVSNAQALGG